MSRKIKLKKTCLGARKQGTGEDGSVPKEHKSQLRAPDGQSWSSLSKKTHIVLGCSPNNKINIHDICTSVLV